MSEWDSDGYNQAEAYDSSPVRLEFVDAGLGRRPARFDVRLGHALVVALEEGHDLLMHLRGLAMIDPGQIGFGPSTIALRVSLQ